MANLSASRLGQVDKAGDVLAIFLKKYGGEVLAAFETKTALKEITRQREIDGGKSAQFPMTFQALGGWHAAGNELTGRAIAHAEKIITVDDLMVSDTVIASIDEAMNHYDVRATYAEEQSRYLAKQFDSNICRMLGLASRVGTATFTGDRYGAQNKVTSATADTDALALADAIWAAKENLDIGDVPVDSGVYAPLLPAQWYLLAKEPTVILNRDISENPGDYSKGWLNTIGGVTLVKSNNLRWGQNDVTGGGPSMDTTKYDVDLTNTVTVVHTEHAVGTVNLIGLNMDSEWQVKHRGYFTVAEYAAGHGILIDKAAAEIATV